MKSIHSCLRSGSGRVFIVLPYVEYGESPKLLPVGHLGLKFQNEVMCFNGSYRTMLMYEYVKARSFSTKSAKDPPAQSQNRPYGCHIGSDRKFYMTYTKVQSYFITVPNMNKIPSFMSEIWIRKGYHYTAIC